MTNTKTETIASIEHAEQTALDTVAKAKEDAAAAQKNLDTAHEEALQKIRQTASPLKERALQLAEKEVTQYAKQLEQATASQLKELDAVPPARHEKAVQLIVDRIRTS